MISYLETFAHKYEQKHAKDFKRIRFHLFALYGVVKVLVWKFNSHRSYSPPELQRPPVTPLSTPSQVHEADLTLDLF